MTIPFNAESGLIVVRARLHGPAGSAWADLALDTGATFSTLSSAKFIYLGYDPASSPQRIRVTTGSGVEYTPKVSVQKIEALGREVLGFDMLCHTLPPTTTVDGLLGLDFLRGLKLTVDFRNATLTLE